MITSQHPLLELRESGIAGAGMGVWAKSPIASGMVLFNYNCNVNPSPLPPQLNHDREYRFDVATDNTKQTITYSVTLSDLGGYINDTVDFRPLTQAESIALFNGSPPRLKQHNCKYIHDINTKIMQIVACADIAAGSELFVDYGVNYWVPRYIRARYITGIARFTPCVKK